VSSSPIEAGLPEPRTVEPATRAATAALLWAAAHPLPDPATITWTAARPVDGALLVGAAAQQRVGPLVWRSLGIGKRRDALGEGPCSELRQDADYWRARGLALPEALSAAIQPLTSAGLEPLLYKGPAAARRYPSPALRPMDDIDLILPRPQHGSALTALSSAGWRVIAPLRRGRHDTLLAHPDVRGLVLELHSALDSWFERFTGLDGEAVWRRRRAATVFGTDVFVASAEDEVLALAVHAGKPYHCFDRLIWAVDIALLAGAGGSRIDPLDWDLVGQRSRQAHCRTVLAVALTAAQRLGGRPPRGLTELPADWRGPGLAPLLAPEWPLDPTGLRERRIARYALADRWPERLRLIAGERIDLPPGPRTRHLVDTTRRAVRRWWLLQGAASPNLARRASLTAASPILGVALRLLPVTLVWRGLDTVARSLPARRRPLPADGGAALAQALATDVDAVLGLPLRGLRGRCLKRSLLLYALLRRRGLRPQWTVGHLVEPDGSLAAHAWCSLDGSAVAEPPGVEASYRALLQRGG